MDDNYGSEKGFLNGVKPCHHDKRWCFGGVAKGCSYEGIFWIKSNSSTAKWKLEFKEDAYRHLIAVLLGLPWRLVALWFSLFVVLDVRFRNMGHFIGQPVLQISTSNWSFCVNRNNMSPRIPNYDKIYPGS